MIHELDILSICRAYCQQYYMEDHWNNSKHLFHSIFFFNVEIRVPTHDELLRPVKPFTESRKNSNILKTFYFNPFCWSQIYSFFVDIILSSS